MASHSIPGPPAAAAIPESAHSFRKPWMRWALPSFSDCLFLAVLVWLLATGSGAWISLLRDGDSGWHIRTGDWIREHGAVPQVDLFSFVKGGEPWFAWEWLTDLVFSIVHELAGLKGLVLLSVFQLSLFGTVLFRHMIWRGTTPFVALPLTLLVFGASTIHFLARPHLVTMLLLVVCAWIIEADRRSPSNRVWLLVPITVLWVNMHGGFLALIACLGLLTAGTVVQTVVANGGLPKPEGWAPVKRYALLTAVCGIASVVNPYGVKLHGHIAAYLQSDFIKNHVQEFQSPTFRSENALHFEIMLFAGLITVSYLLARRDFVGALWVMFWAHSALTSVRHVPLFMIIAAPYVGQALDGLWRRWVETAPRASTPGILASLGRDMLPNCCRSSALIPLAMLLVYLTPDSILRWPQDYPDLVFPVRMVAKHGDKISTGKTLMPDQWADYAIYRQYPKQRVYLDGRSDFFGKEIGQEYINMSTGHWDWEKLIEKNGFQYVMCPPTWSLSSLLKRDPRWTLLADDGQALLFERKQLLRASGSASHD